MTPTLRVGLAALSSCLALLVACGPSVPPPPGGTGTGGGTGFTKVSATGQDLPDTALAWACVRQNATGALWEAQLNRTGTYTNYWNANTGDTGTLVDQLNIKTSYRCGVQGWRLPTQSESLALVTDPAWQVAPSISQYTWFGDPVTSGWTSDAVGTAANPTNKWVVNFDRTPNRASLSMASSQTVRLIHAINQPPSWPVGGAALSAVQVIGGWSVAEWVPAVDSMSLPSSLSYHVYQGAGSDVTPPSGDLGVNLQGTSRYAFKTPAALMGVSSAMRVVAQDPLGAQSTPSDPVLLLPTAAVIDGVSLLTDTGTDANSCFQAGSDVLVSCDSPAARALNPMQDGMLGRDVANPNPSDGKLGFNYTKLDANGVALPASATAWSCVKDNVTGLTWEVKTTDGGLRDMRNSYTNLGDNSLGDASTFVTAVNVVGLCGSTNWRLPTVDELQSIVDYGSVNPAIDTTFFPNTLGNYSSWTSSPMAGSPSLAWYDSNGDVYYVNRNNTFAVRLVR